MADEPATKRLRLCPHCGYDVTGLPVTSGEITCPECGNSYARSQSLYGGGSSARLVTWCVASWLVPCALSIWIMLGYNFGLSGPGWMEPVMLMLPVIGIVISTVLISRGMQMRLRRSVPPRLRKRYLAMWLPPAIIASAIPPVLLLLFQLFMLASAGC